MSVCKRVGGVCRQFGWYRESKAFVPVRGDESLFCLPACAAEKGVISMIQPNCETIEALCSQYDIIPLCKEIYADMTTPIALLCRIAQRSDSYFLLESVEGGEKWGRYSFLGYDPILRATCRNGVVTVEEKGCSRQVETTRPMVPSGTSFPLPCASVAGYASFYRRLCRVFFPMP